MTASVKDKAPAAEAPEAKGGKQKLVVILLVVLLAAGGGA